MIFKISITTANRLLGVTCNVHKVLVEYVGNISDQAIFLPQEYIIDLLKFA